MPKRIPAAAASADPSANVRAAMVLSGTPIRGTTAKSNAIARMDIPHTVLRTDAGRGSGPQRPIPYPLDDHADERGQEHGEEDGHHQDQPVGHGEYARGSKGDEAHGDPESDVRPDHEDVAVREVEEQEDVVHP